MLAELTMFVKRENVKREEITHHVSPSGDYVYHIVTLCAREMRERPFFKMGAVFVNPPDCESGWTQGFVVIYPVITSFLHQFDAVATGWRLLNYGERRWGLTVFSMPVCQNSDFQVR
jgi:hypothetical protein